MLQKAHEGHLGVVKTLSRVREVIWWPGVSNAIRQTIMHCETCMCGISTTAKKRAFAAD